MISEVQGLKSLAHTNGYRVLENKGLVIVWMSVGNGYFKKENIKEILNFVTKKFSKVVLMVPFEPAVYTYLGMGYEINKAQSKARLTSNRLKNISKQLIKEYNFASNCDINIVDWITDVIEKIEFKESLKQIQKLFNDNIKFNNDARDTTKIVLEEKMKEGKLLKEGIDIAVSYLLEELAFIFASPYLFNVDETTYLYHREWPIYENLINGLYDNQERKKVGFLLTK